MKAIKLVVQFEDGSTQELYFSEPKPSNVSGKLNQNASGKVINTKGERFQLGCNLTRLDK